MIVFIITLRKFGICELNHFGWVGECFVVDFVGNFLLKGTCLGSISICIGFFVLVRDCIWNIPSCD